MIGTVKWFNAKKGFGFITADAGGEYFAHHTAIDARGFRELKAGQRVSFTGTSTSKGLKALNIQVTA